MLMFGIVAVPVEWFCLHSFQKKKARGIAKKVVGLFLRAALSLKLRMSDLRACEKSGLKPWKVRS